MIDPDQRILLLIPAKDGSFHNKCLPDCSVMAEHIPIDVSIQSDSLFFSLFRNSSNNIFWQSMA